MMEPELIAMLERQLVGLQERAREYRNLSRQYAEAAASAEAETVTLAELVEHAKAGKVKVS